VFPSESGAAIEMNNFSERVFKPLLAALCGRVEWWAE